MKPSLRALAACVPLLLSSTAVSAANPAHLWSAQIGGPSSDIVSGVGHDEYGNLYVAGDFIGTITLGGNDLVSAGGTDIFLVKYSPLGVVLWSKRFGGINTDSVGAIALDGGGNVVLVADFSGLANFGGSDLTSVGGSDIALAKYNSAGTHQFSARYGNTGTDSPNDVTCALGNIYVTGMFNGTVSFGGAGLVSAGGNDIFVASYNSIGTHVWSQRFGSTGTDEALAVSFDEANDDLCLTGYFSGTVSFGGANLVSAGGMDIFLAQFVGSTGAHQWSKRFGSASSSELGRGVAHTQGGDVVLTGGFASTVNFGGSNLVSAGGADIVLARFNSAGTHLWSQSYGGTSTDHGTEIDVDSAGNVFLAGIYFGAIHVGGDVLPSFHSDELFVASYDPSGAHRWSAGYASLFADFPMDVDVSELGQPAVGGYFAQTIDFGNGPITTFGSNDGIVVRYGGGAAEPLISSIADVGNDQGRKVKVRFDASGGDVLLNATPVTSYEAYRRDDPPPSAAATLLSTRDELLAAGWSFVGSAPAHNEDSYALDVATVADSTVALGMYHSVFFVRASTGNPSVFYDSPIDSGYSKDNLAPGIPDNLIYSAGDLEWDESAADDFDFFTVYGANVDAFGSAVVVNYTTALAMDVTASPYVFYFVTATDFSGNEGKPAKINTLSGAGGTPTRYVLSVSNYPNPFNPRTTVSYTVPSRGHVRVAVFDARGSQVVTLFEGERPAGAFSIDWNPGAAVSSGIYFARIEHNGATRSKKMVLLK